MKVIKHILILLTFSCLAHLVGHLVFYKIIEHEFPDDQLFIIIISTIILISAVSYFILKYLQNSRSKFLKVLFIIIASQCLTIVILTIYYHIRQVMRFTPDATAIALKFDYVGFFLRILFFGCLLPLVGLTPCYLLDKLRNNNYS